MGDMENITFTVITCSDRASAGVYENRTGPWIAEQVIAAGGSILNQVLIADEKRSIANEIKHGLIGDVIITTGGTGVHPKDVTPEATMPLLDTLLPGISEALRMQGMSSTPRAMISRGVAGFSGKTLIINLPGSEGSVHDGWELVSQVIPHLVRQRQGNEGH
ncbi:MAG: MogA/MoaB family molybdenum cofactor biosynthesis protein [Candidatus Nanopelagicales bacterium]